MTLLQATEEGFVDDNIQTTLENLFPVGGHFYVGGQTYSIVDALWTKGSWKIDKQLMDIGQLNNIKTKNPLLFNSILTNLINNNNEINELPATVRYGSNYTPPQKAQTTGATAGAIQPTPQQTQEIQQIQQFQQQLIQQGQIPQVNPVPPNLQIGYQPQFNLPIQRNPLPQYPMSQNLQIGYQQQQQPIPAR